MTYRRLPVRDFEPWHVFRTLPLSVAQVRALVRTAVQVHQNEPLVLPLDVPA